MQHDMDLVREILLRRIENSSDDEDRIDMAFENHSEQEVGHHLILLEERGLIEAEIRSIRKVKKIIPKRLTWEGHDFLSAIRNENVWRKTKDSIAKNGGGFVLGVVKDLATSILRKEMGLS